MSARKVLLSWSSGKDSAWSLHQLRQDPQYEVVGLFTTINSRHDRVAMHAVRSSLLERQARAVGLSLRTAAIPHPCPNEIYESIVARTLERVADEGIEAIAFGDLFLEDIRAYRERQAEGLGLEPLFPLWGRDTGELAREMIDGGVVASLTCVDPRQCPAHLAGRQFDAALLEELPAGADPCGENGEFHTFVNGGPMFAANFDVDRGVVVEREGFVFADLLPAGNG